MLGIEIEEVEYIYWYSVQVLSTENTRLHPRQCGGSEQLLSGSGSSLHFRQVRVQIQKKKFMFIQVFKKYSKNMHTKICK